MSLNCRRLLDQRFLNSIRHNSFAPRLRIAANPCNRALHKKSGNQSNVKKQAVKFTWGERAFKGFSILVIIEVVCLGISYVQWSLMNKDSEYRWIKLKWCEIVIMKLQVQHDQKQHRQHDAGRILFIWWADGPQQQDQGAWPEALADAGSQCVNWRRAVVTKFLVYYMAQLKVSCVNGCDTLTCSVQDTIYAETLWRLCVLK